jgi:hypothetical protein
MHMASDPVDRLTKQDVVRFARTFEWRKKMPKWTVMVEAREHPARPLLLLAAGVPPNDSTNSHSAVAKLKAFGFDVRYEGKSV